MTKSSYLVRKHVVSYLRVEERGRRILSDGTARKQKCKQCLQWAVNGFTIPWSRNTYCVLGSGTESE